MHSTDKDFWHRYIPVYEEAFNRLRVMPKIVEIGVYKGASIQYLMERFPSAKIFGADICAVQDTWPRSPNVEYMWIDQDNIPSIQTMFAITGLVDLIIEDGSHNPDHQLSCLFEGFKHLNRGGIYILEDIHTSLPNGESPIKPNVLNLLLFFEHCKSLDILGIGNIIPEEFLVLREGSKIIDLYHAIDSIKIFKRATLPLKCYACGSSDFDYTFLKCKCGVDIYSPRDSMTVIIQSV